MSSPAAGNPGERVALVVTTAGLAGVPVGTSSPRWVVPGAVAAPDGSAVFVLDGPRGQTGDQFDVVRIDPSTGAKVIVGSLSAPETTRVSAVEPGGKRVVLADRGGASTSVIDVDGFEGVTLSRQSFEGRVEPEAFSLDHTRLFAARIYEDRYHVHVLELATGQQYPTIGPDKTRQPEDMYGSIVQAALSPDRTQLATLYRDAVKPSHTAFVHLLNLDNGLTVCIDLHAPFGTGSVSADAILWRDDGVIAVGHRDADPARSMTATFDPKGIWLNGGEPHYHADARPDPSPPGLPEGVAGAPGFVRFVSFAG
jgi:hypothetical protein